MAGSEEDPPDPPNSPDAPELSAASATELWARLAAVGAPGLDGAGGGGTDSDSNSDSDSNPNPDPNSDLDPDPSAADPDAVVAVLGALQAELLDEPMRWEAPDREHVRILEALLDHDRPRVRAGAFVVLSYVVPDDPTEPDDDYDLADLDWSPIAGRLLARLDDDHRLVRQVAVSTGLVGGLLERALDDESFAPQSRSWLARALVDRLRDPAPVVRKRAASHLESESLALLEVHPDPATAVDALVDALGDDLDGLAPNRDPETPREVALRILAEYAEEDPDPVADRVGAVADLFDDPVRRGRRAAVKLVGSLVDAGAVDPEAVRPGVVEALDRDRYPLTRWGTALAIDLAADDPTGDGPPVADRLARQLRLAVGGERTDYPHCCRGGRRFVEATARLLAAADPDAHPALETLAELVDEAEDADRTDRGAGGDGGPDGDGGGRGADASDGSAEGEAGDGGAGDGATIDPREVDPLVALAGAHPGFVADQLRQGYRKILDGEYVEYRFDEDLAARVARRSAAAVEGLPAVLTADLSDETLLAAAERLARERPEMVAEHLPAALATADHRVPVDPTLADLVERTAPHWQGAPGDLVADLVATVEYVVGPDRNYSRARHRRHAVRALVALYEAGHDVPRRVDPFVEPSRKGAFDDDPPDGEPVDPLETTAAALGGWEPRD